MSAPAPRKPIVGAAIVTAIAVCCLAGLGFWQMQRLHWKEAVLARIAERVRQPPAPLPPQANWAAIQPDDYDYTHVRAKGRYLPDTETLIFRSVAPDRADLSAGPGYQVFDALKLETGGIVLVNRGFAPLAWKDDPKLRTPPSAGEVEVTGLLRPPEERNMFTPADQPDKRLWFTRDPQAMAKQLGLADVAPFAIDQDARPGETAWPHAGATELKIPNNHLSYALTWFGLAATLAVFFAVWAARRGNQ